MTSKTRALVYGAYGYTGALVVRLAEERGLLPILAGRDEGKLDAVGRAHAPDLPRRVVSLDDPSGLDAALADVGVVLHCAGPFARTSEPMADACLRTGTHYLDITGEIGVFEALLRRDAEAKARGVMLLPGIGFDVVPTDCVAGWLKERLPDATHLVLAFAALGGRSSRGTAKTAIENLHRGGAVRRDGRLVLVPSAHERRTIDFGDGRERLVAAIPWGDLSTAFASTGIPNIAVFMAVPPAVARTMRLANLARPLLKLGAVQSLLRARVDTGPPGPSDEERAAGVCLFWGEARDADGRVVTERLRTGEGYTLTALSGIEACKRVLAGEVHPGFQTPSTAFGPDYVLCLPGTERAAP